MDYSEEHTMNGVVTRFCNDYGLINDQIYFTNAVVVGREPLSVGQHVSVVFEEDKISGGWRATMVHCISDRWEGDAPDTVQDLSIKVLIGSITFCNKDGGDINQSTYFSMCDVCEGYEPYKGDWVKAEYFINPTTWNSEACSVKPLRCKRVDNVKISAFYGRTGVLDESIYFTLDSMRLPQGYRPKREDSVNAVVVESSQSCYVWRALCIAPVSRNGLTASNGENSSDQYSTSLMMNKGGLEVSRLTNFGVIKQGESKPLHICIQNKGNETQSLISCKLAGWEKENLFKFEMNDPKSDSLKDISAAAHSSSLSAEEGTCSDGTSQQTSSVMANCLSSAFCQGGKHIYNLNPLLLGHYPKCGSIAAPLLTSGLYKSWRQFDQDHADATSRINSLTIDEEPSEAENRSTCNEGNNCEADNIEVQENTSDGKSEAMVIAPGEETFITVICEAKNPGRCRELLLFCFTEFIIGRYLEANIISEEESLLLPFKEYSANKSKVLPEPALSQKVVLSAPQRRTVTEHKADESKLKHQSIPLDVKMQVLHRL
ncbi:RNA helicase Mov10l1-like [Discoglossus pictus]